MNKWFLTLLMLLGLLCPSTYAATSNREDTIINASPEAVWEAIIREKDVDEAVINYKEVELKPLTNIERDSILYEEIHLAPILPNDHLVFTIREFYLDRIIYWCDRSLYFNRLDGCWILAGDSLSLYCTIETKLPLPSFLIKNLLKENMKKRLQKIKEVAEK